MKTLKNKVAAGIVSGLLTLGASTDSVDAGQPCFNGGSFHGGFSGGTYFGGGRINTSFNGGSYYSRSSSSQINVAYPYYDRYNVQSQNQPVNCPTHVKPNIQAVVPEGYTLHVRANGGNSYSMAYSYPNQNNTNQVYQEGYSTGGYYDALQQQQNYQNQQDIQYQQDPRPLPPPTYYESQDRNYYDQNNKGIDDRQEQYYAPDVNNNGIDDRNEYSQYRPGGAVRGIVGGTVIVGGSVVQGTGTVVRVVGRSLEQVGSGLEKIGNGITESGDRIIHPYRY